MNNQPFQLITSPTRPTRLGPRKPMPVEEKRTFLVMNNPEELLGWHRAWRQEDNQTITGKYEATSSHYHVLY